MNFRPAKVRDAYDGAVVEHDLPDLIHLADDLGNSVVLRLTKPVPEGELTGEIEVRSYFVSGRKKTWVSPDDLTSWETVLDDLSRGDNTAWREGQRATEIWLELDDFDRVIVSVVDRMSSLVSVELTIEVADGWLENHYKRLNAIRKMQPG